MLRELIIPVGTSMLKNWMPRIDPEVRVPQSWLGATANAGIDAAPPDQRTWIPKFQAGLRGDGRTSAELDSTRRWIAKRCQVQVSRITLLVSDTPAAQWVASALQSLMPTLVDNAVSVESYTVRRLRTEDMREGLVEFIRVSAHAIKAAHSRGAVPVVNATPGFKAEAALLTLLGALLGAETVYLHEDMQDVIVVPAIPLQWGLQDHEIRTLRQVGEAVSRDSARDLGIGSHPILWPFIERLEDGEDELWGLSALGQMVVESSTEGSSESPPDRNGAWTFEASSVEKGHQPHDAAALAKQIAERLPFVTMVRLYWWQGHGDPGVLMPRADDQSARIVRLRLRSSDRSLRPLFLLYTTAENEEQWKTARQRATEAFGRVRLVEELAYASNEAEPSSDLDQAPEDLAQLRTEQLLQAQLNRSEMQVAEVRKQVAERDEALVRANTANEQLKAQLTDQKEVNRADKALLKSRADEAERLMDEIKSLRAELERTKAEVVSSNSAAGNSG